MLKPFKVGDYIKEDGGGNEGVVTVIELFYTKLTKAVLQKVLDEDEAVLKDKEHFVYVDDLAESAVNIGIRCWFSMDAYWQGKWRVTENVKYALDGAGIAIPYPQMDVHVCGETQREEK